VWRSDRKGRRILCAPDDMRGEIEEDWRRIRREKWFHNDEAVMMHEIETELQQLTTMLQTQLTKRDESDVIEETAEAPSASIAPPLDPASRLRRMRAIYQLVLSRESEGIADQRDAAVLRGLRRALLAQLFDLAPPLQRRVKTAVDSLMAQLAEDIIRIEAAAKRKKQMEKEAARQNGGDNSRALANELEWARSAARMNATAKSGQPMEFSQRTNISQFVHSISASAHRTHPFTSLSLLLLVGSAASLREWAELMRQLIFPSAAR
jgi:Skp family chaperone for outer membrane proteins